LSGSSVASELPSDTAAGAAPIKDAKNLQRRNSLDTDKLQQGWRKEAVEEDAGVGSPRRRSKPHILGQLMKEGKEGEGGGGDEERGDECDEKDRALLMAAANVPCCAGSVVLVYYYR
jgi:hypothetical protein